MTSCIEPNYLDNKKIISSFPYSHSKQSSIYDDKNIHKPDYNRVITYIIQTLIWPALFISNVLEKCPVLLLAAVSPGSWISMHLPRKHDAARYQVAKLSWLLTCVFHRDVSLLHLLSKYLPIHEWFHQLWTLNWPIVKMLKHVLIYLNILKYKCKSRNLCMSNVQMFYQNKVCQLWRCDRKCDCRILVALRM